MYSCVIFVLFFIASIAFTADNGGSQLEKAAVVRELDRVTSSPDPAPPSLPVLLSDVSPPPPGVWVPGLLAVRG